MALALGAAVGARVAMFLRVIAFGLGALLLRPVREPRRGRRVDGLPAGDDEATLSA